MFLGDSAKQWDNNIYFSADFQKFKHLASKINRGQMSTPHGKITNREQMINEVITNQRIILGQQVLVLNLWTYKTPIYEWQYSSYLFYHEYVILELWVNNKDKLYCSIQKDQTKIKIFYHDQFQKVRDYTPQMDQPQNQLKKRFTNQYWKPIKLKQSQVMCDYFQLIRFLYINQEDKKGYNLFSSNCQDFCGQVIKFLQNNYT